MKTHTIDAQGKKLGRLASEVASLLMGKDEAAFRRNIPSSATVRVVNAARLLLGQEKMRSKKYTRYSGYPGGLKEESLGSLVRRRGGAEAIKRAVYGMLPSNKLRNDMMKRLSISE